jgi:hypothetical protein
MRIWGGSVVLLAGALLGGCATRSAPPVTTTTEAGSLNATPCNYAQAWHDNPGQFSEYSTMARYAGMASNAGLRAEGRQLASALAKQDTAAIGALAGSVFATCQKLGFVRPPSATSSTTP